MNIMEAAVLMRQGYRMVRQKHRDCFAIFCNTDGYCAQGIGRKYNARIHVDDLIADDWKVFKNWEKKTKVKP
ncbi:Uncharacterised protein [Candidatus Anstonella stagnisolia]|nr:Uncharacterised protein [Candidatus Anstonella stagnisolia]